MAEDQIKQPLTSEAIANLVISDFTTLPKNIVIRDKTIEQWQKHFSVEIDKSKLRDLAYLRNLLADIASLIDECSHIYASMKMSAENMGMQAFMELNNAININPKQLKSLSAREKDAKRSVADITAAQKLAELLCIPWEQYLFNLRGRARMVESALMSVSSELKNFGRGMDVKIE